MPRIMNCLRFFVVIFFTNGYTFERILYFGQVWYILLIDTAKIWPDPIVAGVGGNDMEKTGKTKQKKYVTLAVMAALFAVSLMCSCTGGGAAKSVNSEPAKASAEQLSGGSTSAENSMEKTVRRTVQIDLSDEEEEETVLDFGSETPFGGIEVETDENGELVCTEQGTSIWYKVTDSRFGTYNQLSRFVRRNMSSSEASDFLSQANVYFITSDGGLYFVDGSGGRTISNTKRYVLSGGSTVRFSSAHTPECRKKYGITRSSVEFVKSDGTWKLCSMRNS